MLIQYPPDFNANFFMAAMADHIQACSHDFKTEEDMLRNLFLWQELRAEA